MKLRTKLAVLIGALALALTPATALAGQPEDPGSQGKGPHYTPEVPAPEQPETPGPKASLPEKAKAYGVYCRGESRKHVEGEKGTAFSRCVTTMARLANNESLTPRQACKNESRKHVKGEKGTAFSRCVTAAAKLRKQQHEEEQQQA
ncbi:MAG: hypothetical protein ACTHN3_04930 [Solirubrobacterales bacterium]